MIFNSESEDDGFIVSLLFNGETKDSFSECLVFDALNISAGPLYRLAIPTNIPIGFHGCWADGLVFDEEDMARKWKVQ